MTGHRNTYALDGPVRFVAWAAGSLGLAVMIFGHRLLEAYDAAHVDLGGED